MRIEETGKHSGNDKYIFRSLRGAIIYRIHFILCLAIMLSGIMAANTTQAADLSALPRSVVVTESGHRTSYHIKSVPTVTLNGLEQNSGYPLIQLKQVWMAAGEQFFRDQLGFAYSYDETTGVIRMKNPALDASFEFTLDSTYASVNGEPITLEYAPVKAKDVTTGEKAILLPLVNIIEKSNMSVQASKSTIAITHDLLYYRVTLPDAEWNKDNAYTNAVDGICIKTTDTDGERAFYVDTMLNLSNADVIYTDNGKATGVEITFPKTKNLLGNLTESFSDGAIKRIDIKEDAAFNTIITLEYDIKYMYNKKFSGTHVITTFRLADFDLRVTLPEDVEFSSIKSTDQYWKKRFLIIIPGDYVSYYKDSPPVKNCSAIKNIAIAETAEGNTKITVTTKTLQGYRLEEDNGFFSVEIGSPRSIYENIVMLDAGHGGKDNGAVRNGLTEKDLNYTIIYTKAKQYFEAQDSTVKAYWTRHNDTFINLYQRPKYSANYYADLFISLHMNAGASRAANGTEVYYSAQNNKRNSAGLTSKIFAKRMCSTIVNDLGTNRRGVKQAGFVVIKYNTVPSVLIELGFVSGNRDSKNLRKSTYQNRAAKSIYRGVSNIFRSYPTGR